MMLTDLADACRKSGLDVIELPGWKTRARPASTGDFDPRGVLCHHTGTHGDGRRQADSMALVGRSDLPPPLCQLALDRNGDVYVCAAGRSNHAGKAKAQGTLPAGDGNAMYVGIEAMNTGSEGWTAKQYDAYVRLVAALCEHYGWATENVRGHKETSVTGKPDPGLIDMDEFRADVAARRKPTPKPLVDRNRTRVAAVNMHAPGADDDLRMEKAIDRFRHLDFTVVALSEFNLPMARKLREFPKWGLHRAEPNSGTAGNAVAFWKPVWRKVAVEDIDVMLSSRVLHMSGLVLEHRRTGFVLPVLSIHNPTSTRNVHVPQSDRDLCTESELAWASRMETDHGRALVLGDLNDARRSALYPMTRAAGHGVDQVYGLGTTFSKPLVHPGLDPTITDHAAVSVLVNVIQEAS